jgi:lipopolysaccharide biosynthesis glycosyltransferase
MDRSATTAKIPVVFAFDAEYAPYAAVAAASLLEHSVTPIEIFCIVPELPLGKVNLFDTVQTRYDTQVHFIKGSPEAYFGWKTTNYFQSVNYLRLQIADLVDRPRAIYLDADLVVTTDLTELYNVHLGDDKWIAGCVNEKGDNQALLPCNEPYINSGVMVLDLKKMRASKFLQSCTNSYNNNIDKIIFQDQCVINHAAIGRKKLIEHRWNIMLHVARWGEMDLDPEYWNNAQKLAKPFIGSGIIHSSGMIKPWMTCANPWVADLWTSYANIITNADDLIKAPQTKHQEHLQKRVFELRSGSAQSISSGKLLADSEIFVPNRRTPNR